MAKDVITRFKLETTQYDSKLREASKSLANFSKTATQAKEGFDKFTKGNIEAARALGTTATSSANAKQQVQELVTAFNEAAKAYNQLTKEQQQSDFGKAMAASLQQLQQRIRDTKEEMQGLSTSNKGLFSRMGDKMTGAMQVFAGNMMTKATMAVADFGSELVGMVQQGVELAKAGEGIRIAFERLGRGDILAGLREATHGTVTDLELMKAAVKFNDFKLPIEELGTMLAFAQQKAKDTGQSVDYMVDSIVTGLGRKSLMILDNLGLSAAEIKDKMAETGDMTKAVGEIIREQMSKAGDYVETAADRAAQANVDLQNKLEELGRKFAPVEEASNQLWTSMKIGILDIVGGPLARLLNGLTEAGRLRNQMNDMAGGNSSSETEKQLNFLRKTSPANRQQRYNKQLGIYTQQENAAWREVNSLKGQRESFRKEALKRGARDDDWTVYADFDKKIAEAERKAKAWQNFRADYIRGAKELIKPVEVDIKTDNAVKGVDSLKVKLAELEAQRKKAIKAGDQDLAKNLTKQITQTKSDIKALDPNALKTTTSHTLTKPEQADAKYVQAQKDYEQSLQQAALEVKAGTINSAEAKKKELQAAETLWKSIGDAREVYDSPKLKEAQAKVEERIVALGPEVNKAIEAQKAVEKASQELEKANKKAAEAYAKLGSTGGVASLISVLKSKQAAQTIGSTEWEDTTARLRGAENLQTITDRALASGVDASKVAEMTEPLRNALKDNLIDKDGVKKMVTDLVDSMNEQMAESPLKMQVVVDNAGIVQASKNLTTEVEKQREAWKKTGTVIGLVGQAFNAFEDPAAKIMGTVAQAIATVALAYADAMAKDQTQKFNIFGFIAAATAATISMASTIASIHSATGYAQGGIVKGDSYSGDNIPASTFVNAGELVLNRAQQGNLASQLEQGGGAVGGGVPYVTGETIFLGLNNYMRSHGYGELIPSRR